MYFIRMRFGRNEIRYRIHYKETLRYLAPYWSFCSPAGGELTVSQEYQDSNERLVPPQASSSYREYKLLLFMTARALIPNRTIIFHGVAILWNGLAWIITAPSGTGKTTQLKMWARIYGSEMKLISGDMPVLEFEENGDIMVFPTPWNGKERYGNTKYFGRLAGIVLLEQGNVNFIERIRPCQSVRPLFLEIASIPDTASEILLVSEMEKALLEHIPVWKLINIGDQASAVLTHETFLKYLGGSLDAT